MLAGGELTRVGELASVIELGASDVVSTTDTVAGVLIGELIDAVVGSEKGVEGGAVRKTVPVDEDDCP